ncbi:hypothetical protein [Bosea sp. (in: a-proteobacteria)]|jgi:hypothetical protein|uniref:hypothetical protein n=1 Tax=Bosea sp. (in: a-proteobacteria) TaxID=1871050 RepID=UPI0035663B0A
MQTKLLEEHGLKAAIGTLWKFLDRRDLTVKKPRTRPSKTAPTSRSGARHGSGASPNSTRAPDLHRRDRRQHEDGKTARPGPAWPVPSCGIPHGHCKTTTFVVDLRLTRMTAPMVLGGPMNREAFIAYASQALGPTIAPGDIGPGTSRNNVPMLLSCSVLLLSDGTAGRRIIC